MRTSVPQVMPIEKWKLLFVRWIEAATAMTKETGDFSYIDEAVAEVRRFYEERLKVAANKHGEWGYLDDVRRALELIEQNIESAKRRRTAA